MDIHHILTGRGDATLIVSPRGRLALIDAGAATGDPAAMVPARPNASRRPGEWIARYVARRMAETGAPGLDSLTLTHLHPDHIGGMRDDLPYAPGRHFRLTGASDVAAAVPVTTLLDPDFPDYDPARFEDREGAANYVAFARARAEAGAHCERLAVGTTGQLLRDEPDFSVRTVASRGRVWTGRRDASAAVLRLPRGQGGAGMPNENSASAAILLSCGSFRYFAGGDLTDWADGGARPERNALTPVARACGAVDVAVAPHHGMYDAASSETVRALAARVWLVSAWHAAHPSLPTLERLTNPRLYGGERQVFATDVHPAAVLAMPWAVARLAGRGGHLLCRVHPGGDRYQIAVVDAADERDSPLLVTPPILARRAR